MQTLRAFLLIRQAREEWTVSVHRDLESLLAAWKPFEDQNGITGVVHVGFGRPDTRAFEETAERYPGRMLLTASARYALGSLGDCAPQAAGQADRLPLYIALSGWGYTTKADELGLAQVPNTSIPSLPTRDTFRGDQINWPTQFEGEALLEPSECSLNWVQGLSSLNPELLAIANNAGIVDEKSYFEREQMLDAAHRARLGYCRLRIFLGLKDYQNPIEISRFAPPWLLSRSIPSLGFSIRAQNALMAAGIHRVVDIARFSLPKGLLGLPNFGQKTYHDVAKALMAALHKGPMGATDTLLTITQVPENPSDVDTADLGSSEELKVNAARALVQKATFVEILEEAIKELPKGRDFIIKRRMGFDGRHSTLQEIADIVGVTRERIRQIEGYAVRTLSVLPLWSAAVAPKIEAMLTGRTEPLPLLGLDVLDPWFRGIEDIPEPFDYCLEHFCGGRLSLIRASSQIFVSLLTPAEWNEAGDQGKKILEAAVGQQWRLSHVRSVIDGLLSGKGEELRPELWAAVTPHARFSHVDEDEPVLVAYGCGVEQLVEAILADSDYPLHYTVIVRKIAERFDRPIETRYAHAATGRVGLLYGRGTYGLMRHFPLSDDEADLVVAETEDLIESGKAERQWHCNEICDALAERGIDFEGRLNPYVVNIALQRSKSLAYLGRLMWTAAAGRKLTSVHRIDVHQAIVSLLRDEGRPMNYLQIREKLAKERGLSDYFQIFPRDPLIHLGRGIWGLLDRDLLLTETEQEAVFDEIAEVLRQRQSGLHVTEIVGSLTKNRELAERIDGTMLMALAQRSGRMRVSYGQYLYLPKWGEPRRMQLADAVKTALKKSPNGLRAQELVEVASVLIGRPINRDAIYGPLSTIGAEWTEKTGRWSLADATEENGDEEYEAVAEEILSKSI